MAFILIAFSVSALIKVMGINLGNEDRQMNQAATGCHWCSILKDPHKRLFLSTTSLICYLKCSLDLGFTSKANVTLILIDFCLFSLVMGLLHVTRLSESRGGKKIREEKNLTSNNNRMMTTSFF